MIPNEFDSYHGGYPAVQFVTPQDGPVEMWFCPTTGELYPFIEVPVENGRMKRVRLTLDAGAVTAAAAEDVALPPSVSEHIESPRSRKMWFYKLLSSLKSLR